MAKMDRIPRQDARTRRAFGGIGADFVPYTGAIKSVDLGAFSFTTTGLGTFGNLDVDTLNLNGNVISDSTGTISFDNDNLTTSGTIDGDGLTIGTTSGGTITDIKDEDNLVSDSQTALATQQSIKAYMDNTLSTEYVPYTGAVANVDLGTFNFTTTGIIQAEHLYSTDDAVIGDYLEVGDQISVGNGAYEYTADNSATLNIVDSFATIRMECQRSSGYFASEFFLLRAKNTTSDLLADMGAVGMYGNMNSSPTPPSVTYLYMGATPNDAYNTSIFRVYPTYVRILTDLTIDDDLTVKDDIYQGDNDKHIFGTGNDASIYYNGTDLLIDPKVVGSGKMKVLGNTQLGETATDYHGINTVPVANYGLKLLFSKSTVDSTYGCYLDVDNTANISSSEMVTTGVLVDTDTSGIIGGGVPIAARELCGFRSEVTSADEIDTNGVCEIYGIRNRVRFTGVNTDAHTISLYGSYQSVIDDLGTTGNTAHYGGYYLVTGTADNNYGLWVRVINATNNYGIVLDADGAGGGLWLGEGQDASIHYDGTDLHLNSHQVGDGHIVLDSPKTTTGDPTGVEGKIYWNTVDNVIKMYADGAWRTLASW